MHFKLAQPLRHGLVAPGQERSPHPKGRVPKPKIKRGGLNLISNYRRFGDNFAVRDHLPDGVIRKHAGACHSVPP